MRVLVACEFTGLIRDAFAERGHDAWSCDLRPSERSGQHYQGDVRDILAEAWDLMIAHPPCQYLTRAANHVWNEPGRAEKREKALEFFIMLYDAPIRSVCIENPVGYANTAFRKPNQIIHPYYFGDRELKRTCLWLRGLSNLWYWRQPNLFGEAIMTAYPEPTYVDKTPRKKKRYFTDANHGDKARSRSFPSVAAAMAGQWG